jgi:3-deoxy-D-manno-octulosonic-acid transferase
MVLANARLSEKSQAKGERIGALVRPVAGMLAAVLAQSEADARRLRSFGVVRVKVCGNLKFDVSPNPTLLASGLQWRQMLARPVVLAAVTREGEELPLLQCWSLLEAPRPLLLLVPRHPQRFDIVADMAGDFGFKLQRRRAWTALPSAEALAADVWLGDSMGEMPLYYASSDVALLGGSFGPFGGQNLIEAAACGCPLVMGPHTYNFSEAAELSLAAGAAIRVADVEEGVARAVALARDPSRGEWVRRAFGFAAAHRGSAERMAREVLAVAGSRPAGAAAT